MIISLLFDTNGIAIIQKKSIFYNQWRNQYITMKTVRWYIDPLSFKKKFSITDILAHGAQNVIHIEKFGSIHKNTSICLPYT